MRVGQKQPCQRLGDARVLIVRVKRLHQQFQGIEPDRAVQIGEARMAQTVFAFPRLNGSPEILVCGRDRRCDGLPAGAGDASCPERGPAGRSYIYFGPSCSSLQELFNRVSVQAGLRDMSVAANRPEDEALRNSGGGEPLSERADRTRMLTGS